MYQKNAECFSHNAVEQIQCGISCHHEKIRQKQEFSTAIIQQSIVLTAEESFIRVLTETKRDEWDSNTGIRHKQTDLPNENLYKPYFGFKMLLLGTCIVKQLEKHEQNYVCCRAYCIWINLGIRVQQSWYCSAGSLYTVVNSTLSWGGLIVACFYFVLSSTWFLSLTKK